MSQHKFELLLGENVNTVNIRNKTNPDKDNSFKKVPYFFFEDPLMYFNNSIRSVFLYYDEKENITEIYAYLNTLIDVVFYNKFMSLYGSPSELLVNDGVIYDKKPVTNGGATIKKTAYKLRNGRFEEKPVFMIWKKENYEIKILMKYQQNLSEISFKKIKT